MKDKKKSTSFEKHTLITAVIWIALCLLNIFTYSRRSSLILNVAALISWSVVTIVEIAKYCKNGLNQFQFDKGAICMKKLIALVLTLVCVFTLAGCGEQQQAKELPVPEYPLSKEMVEEAIIKGGLPDNLTIEENDLLEYEGIKSTSYTLRHPTKDLFAGMCLGILTHKAEEFTSLGITVSSIDQTEELTKEEVEQAVRLATYLFWYDKNDTRISDAFMKKFEEGQPLKWEQEIDGIDCQVIYNPNQRQAKFQIAFSTDMETQLGNK